MCEHPNCFERQASARAARRSRPRSRRRTRWCSAGARWRCLRTAAQLLNAAEIAGATGASNHDVVAGHQCSSLTLGEILGWLRQVRGNLGRQRRVHSAEVRSTGSRSEARNVIRSTAHGPKCSTGARKLSRGFRADDASGRAFSRSSSCSLPATTGRSFSEQPPKGRSGERRDQCSGQERSAVGA